MIQLIIKLVLTLANIVLPVPGGPYISTFLYTPPLRFVLIVALPKLLNLSSKLGCKEEGA